MEKLLVTPEEASQVLGLSRTKVYELMTSRAIKSVKIGGSRRIPVAALREYVDRLLAPEVA